MTKREKERFCAFAASLLAPPDGEMVDCLRRGELQSLLEGYVRQWGGDANLPSRCIRGSGGADFLPTVQEEYGRLFGQWEGARISLVESTYKPWTRDRECRMVFSGSAGLVMGDSALHMQELYRQVSLEVPPEFRSMPDHLVLELEFLALLYRFGSPRQVEQFIADHLDWIPELKRALEEADPHPLYRGAVEMISLFLDREMNQTKGKDHGQKKIY